jgi:hypothetical protein
VEWTYVEDGEDRVVEKSYRSSGMTKEEKENQGGICGKRWLEKEKRWKKGGGSTWISLESESGGGKRETKKRGDFEEEKLVNR